MESKSFLKYTLADRPDLAEIANAIRNEVFVVEQNVEPTLEYEFESESNHYLLFINDKAVATARWRETTQGIKLERFATLKSARNKGYGSLILKEVLKDTLPFKKPIYLHAQLGALNFYLDHGFVKKGETFWEADIEHYLMEFPGAGC